VAKAKYDYDPNIENEHAKQTKQNNFLSQMSLIANWVSNFDPGRIDDCFNKNPVPKEIQKLLDRPGGVFGL
jgi:hypothetical protein